MKYFATLLFLCTISTSYTQVFSELLKVVAADRDVQDRFGWSVDISGNYAIVGAYADDFGALDPNMGSAYIFEKTGIADWTFVQKIFNSDQDDYDRFGWSVAIDGNYAIIGAYAEDENEVDAASLSSAGSAYIFERDVTGVWNQVQKIVAADRQAGDEFGFSVDISGTTAVVGAHFESHDEAGLNYIYHTGSAYIFDRMGDGTWTQTQKIVGSGRAADIDFPDGGGGGEDLSDQFGGSVSISGDRILVGAHHHDYDATGGSPLNETGAAYIFDRSGGIWTETVKLQNSDRALEDRFGFAVSISGDFAVVSAHTEDENETGTSTMANAGSAYIFQFSGGSWSQIQKIVPSDRSPGDRFGWDVSIDNETIVVGSIQANSDALDAAPLSNAGAAYTFMWDADLASWVNLNKVDASDRQVEDQLGVSVAISGVNIIVGAYQQNFDETGAVDINDAGAAYFYSQEECTPTSSSQTLTLCAGQTVIVGPNTHTETGVYTDVIASEMGCDSTVTTNLTIIPAPSSSQEVEICFGYSYDIGGSSHTESGLYSDTITNGMGCDSIVHTTLTVSPENSVTHDVTICWGESYTIGASTYTSAGIYTDVITSWALCDCTITTNLIVQLPVDKSVSQSLNWLTAGLDGGTYQWIKCDPYEIIDGATDQSYIAPTVGKYAVIVTEGSCTDTSSCLYVDMLGIDEYNSQNNVLVYPNPNAGKFTVSLPSFTSMACKALVLNTMGKVVYETTLNAEISTLELTDLPPGVYVLKIVREEEIGSIRLIIN